MRSSELKTYTALFLPFDRRHERQNRIRVLCSRARGAGSGGALGRGCGVDENAVSAGAQESETYVNGQRYEDDVADSRDALIPMADVRDLVG